MKILVECNTDTYLMTRIIQTLNLTRKIIRCVGGKGRVIGKLEKSDDGIGLIDEDPGSSQPSDIKCYQEVERYGDIKRLERRNNRKKKLIVICPKIEDWLLKRASKNNISPISFNLKNTPNAIHEINIEKNSNYRNFLNKLLEVDSEIDTLKVWITKILENN